MFCPLRIPLSVRQNFTEKMASVGKQKRKAEAIEKDPEEDRRKQAVSAIVAAATQAGLSKNS